MAFSFKNSPPKKKTFIKILIILIFFLLTTGFYIYNAQNYVIVRFDELGALTKNMSVFYNNFKIGKVVRIEPDEDFKHTLVKINLFHKNMNLPQNTTVKVENFPNGDLYLMFVYPSSPSFAKMKRGDMLEGTAPYSPEQFMLGQNISGVTDIVSLHVIKALKAAESASKEIKNFFTDSSQLIQQNNKAINQSINNTALMTKNLVQTSQNLNQISEKLNYALDSKTLNSMTSNIKNSTANIEDASSNIKNTTSNILYATKDIDKTTQKIDDTISQVNSVAENLNSITTGLNQTLSKKFGGMRIMFGTPVKPQSAIKNACN